MSGTDHLTRLLALLPWLRAHPGVGIEQAAAEFDVTPAQLQKDLELLIVCGLPRQGPEDLIDIQFWGDGIDVVDPQVLTRPLRLAPDEAISLIVGLRLLRDLPGRHDPAVVDALLAKLAEAAGESAAAGDRVNVTIEPGASEAAGAAVREALSSRSALHLRYLVPRRDEVTERTVAPLRIVVRNGHHYLEAWCRSVEEVRLFRMDRVMAAAVLDEPADLPADAQTREISDNVFEPAPTDTLVTLQVTQAGRWLADYASCETVTELADGGLRITLRTPDTRWVTRLVLRLGGAGRVLDPPELAADVADRARRLLAAYQS